MPSRPLTDTEITAIIHNLHSPRDRALVTVGIKTGFRISEILSLQVEDVQGDTVTVKRRHMKGRRQSRTVPLHPLAKEALRDYLQGRTSGPLFDMCRMTAWRIISNAAEAAHLSGTISTHSMRKTFGMNVYMRTNKNIVAAQRALGHASLASTTHYLSVGQDEVDAAILA